MGVGCSTSLAGLIPLGLRYLTGLDACSYTGVALGTRVYPSRLEYTPLLQRTFDCIYLVYNTIYEQIKHLESDIDVLYFNMQTLLRIGAVNFKESDIFNDCGFPG